MAPVVGTVSYLVLVTVLGVLWDGYDPVAQTQSELGAVDAPHTVLMNVGGFMVLGLSILAFAGAYLLLLRRSLARDVAVGLLGLAGLGMVTVGFFPCDPGCVDVTATGRLHGVFSMPGAIGLPGAAIVSAVALREDARFSVLWQGVSLGLGLASLLSGPLIAAEVFPEVNGLLQRVGMWSSLLWMVALSAKLVTLEPR